MNGLRWTIGVFTALTTSALVALNIVGSNFRRSFGASPNSPLWIIGSVIFALLVIASVIWPDRRLLLHVVAVMMVALCVACVILTRETIFIATLGLVYAGVWLTFYYRTVWATRPAGF